MSGLLSNLPTDVDSSSMNAVPGVCSHQPSPHRGIQSGILRGLLSSPVSTYHSSQDSDYVQTTHMELVDKEVDLYLDCLSQSAYTVHTTLQKSLNLLDSNSTNKNLLPEVDEQYSACSKCAPLLVSAASRFSAIYHGPTVLKKRTIISLSQDRECLPKHQR